MNHLKGAARYIFVAKTGIPRLVKEVPFREFRGEQDACVQNSIFGAFLPYKTRLSNPNEIIPPIHYDLFPAIDHEQPANHCQ